MNEPLTDDQVKNLLKSEYPNLFQVEVDRMLKSCRHETWFQQLVKSKRLGEDLNTSSGPVVVASNAGGVAKDEAPAVSEEKYGSTRDKCFDDPDPESLKTDRDRDIRAAEWAIALLLSTHSSRVRHMRASVAIGILRNQLNTSEIASHFNVTTKRVTQIIQEVKDKKISD